MINTFELEVKKSKFIAFAYSLNSLEEVKQILQKLKTENKKCTHICYAYVYNREQVREMAFDDGEPTGTAGKPILNVIKKKNLQNIMVAVVRYFGGIKLGAGGLVRAYTKACSGVLSN